MLFVHLLWVFHLHLIYSIHSFIVIRFFSFFFNHLLYYHRLLLKQLVTMEVIQWISLWNMFKDEFENEKNMLGGSLGDKAAEDLRQRIIEHVVFLCRFSSIQ